MYAFPLSSLGQLPGVRMGRCVPALPLLMFPRAAAAACPGAAPCFAGAYGSGMVLDRSAPNLWGYAPPSGLVTVEVDGAAAAAVSASQDGVWRAALPRARPAGGPHNVTVHTAGGAASTLLDVLFGDVWLCSGQSNMEFGLSEMFNGSAEVAAAADYARIRLFIPGRCNSSRPFADLPSDPIEGWTTPSNTSVGSGWGHMSAVCFLFGKHILERYPDVPIGLIETDYGGTSIQTWSSPDSLAHCGPRLGEVPRDGAPSDDFQCEAANQSWRPQLPSSIYNTNIVPFLNVTITGVIWYQGEADASHYAWYNCTFPRMIADWRQKWHEGTGGLTKPLIPFGFVQLSATGSKTGSGLPPGTGPYPEQRWAQTVGHGYAPNADQPNVFMAVAMDLTDPSSPYGSVHYRDKEDVGYRLALAGRAVAYGDDVVSSGPRVATVKPTGGAAAAAASGTVAAAVVTFDSVGAEGIEVRNTTFGFELAGAGGDWVPAAIIASDRSSVTIRAAMNASALPVSQARYAWHTIPCAAKACAIYSKKEGLPAPPWKGAVA